MKLTQPIIVDEKEYDNVAFSLIVSNRIQGELSTDVILNIQPYSNDLEVLEQHNTSFILNKSMDSDEELTQLKQEIDIAVQKFLTAKGL